MPWEIKRRGSQHCVVKKGESTPVRGGCHATRAEAIKHQRALYANEASSQGDTLSVMGDSSKLWYFIGPNSSQQWTASSSSPDFTFTVSNGAQYALEDVDEDGEQPNEGSTIMWEGVLGLEGKPTDDKRFLIPGEISERELPLSLMVQTITDEGHKGAQLGARIDEIWRVETDDGHLEIWGRGPFDSSDFGQEAARLVEEEFLKGVSLDLAISEAVALDPESFEPIDTDNFDLTDFMNSDFITGIKGTILGATLVPFPAFSESRVSVVTASAGSVVYPEEIKEISRALTASAGPLKPPAEWFEDPQLTELTPLQITKEGRVYGHLADWDGCHTGFQGICVPPFRSATNYSYFNVGEIETSDGELVSCGKIMFCRDGNGHAPIEASAAEASRYYDDATKVGAFVRAGSDRFGTWLAGVLRSDLDDLEIQHLRTHPPSGDWRPVKNGPSELVAAFAVPIPGFPIARALVASGADGEITAIITAPLTVEHELGYRRRKRKKVMLEARLREALGHKPSSRRRMRLEAMKANQDDA